MDNKRKELQNIIEEIDSDINDLMDELNELLLERKEKTNDLCELIKPLKKHEKVRSETIFNDRWVEYKCQ
jgi:ElaB/YqjD/DUF883 family membrane-anchored ribosome-binding protein